MAKPFENTKIVNFNLLILFCVTLMAVMGVSIITPAHPLIVRELNISATQIGLLITAFSFPGTFLSPMLGILADRFGRRRILIPSLFVFGTFGTACALTKDFSLLLIFRFLQGVGAASLGSINLAIIGDLYSGRNRTTAMGYNSSVLSIGTASYPALGGFVAACGWQFPFLFSIIAIPVGILIMVRLKNPEPVSNEKFSIYLTNIFRFILTKKMRSLFLASFTSFVVIYGPYLTYFPFLAEKHSIHSPAMIGILMSISSLTTAIFSFFLGMLAKRFRENNLIKTAFFLYAISLSAIAFTSIQWVLVIALIVLGMASGISIPAVQSLIAEYAPAQQRGAFMSVNGMIIRGGQTLGPIIAASAFSLWGLRGTFYTISLVSLVVMFILWTIPNESKELYSN
ncbi:MAG: MFS transporter [Spirochaetes bacterium]|nr:MFS transporter [Spirochaetota bacterium]